MFYFKSHGKDTKSFGMKKEKNEKFSKKVKDGSADHGQRPTTLRKSPKVEGLSGIIINPFDL
jgi:hypothetical protein